MEKNRKMLEYFVKNNFQNYLIIRLPGIFGTGLKKNVIYDLMNKNELQKIYSNDYFQWYDLEFVKKKTLKVSKLIKIKFMNFTVHLLRIKRL